MTYETFRIVFMAGAVLAVLMLFLSVFLFLFLDIPMVIGDLTGANARKAIAQIQGRNKQKEDKVQIQPSRAEEETTEELSPSGYSDETMPLGGKDTSSSKDAVLDGLTAPLDTETEYFENGDRTFEIEYEITYIHTDEKIS